MKKRVIIWYQAFAKNPYLYIPKSLQEESIGIAQQFHYEELGLAKTLEIPSLYWRAFGGPTTPVWSRRMSLEQE